MIRDGWPELGNIVQAYLANQPETWNTGNPKSETVGDKVNDGFYLFGHRYIWDFETMDLELQRVGFSRIKRCDKKQSDHPDLSDLDFHEDFPGILEATK